MTTITTPLTGSWTVDPAHSAIGFGVTHMNTSTFRATFEQVEGQVVVGDQGIELSGVAAVESVDITSPPEFRQHVLGPDFFDADSHPTITARSREVDLRDDGTVEVRGELTVRDVTRPVTATGTYNGPTETPFGTAVAALELSAVVDRRDFGLTWNMELPAGGDALGHEVTLTAHLELAKEG